MLLTHAAERGCSGNPEMSVFHGLSAGNVGHEPGGAVEVVVVVGAVVDVVELLVVVATVVVVDASVVVEAGTVLVVGAAVVVEPGPPPGSPQAETDANRAPASAREPTGRRPPRLRQPTAAYRQDMRCA
jgi:hypothetical protein